MPVLSRAQIQVAIADERFAPYLAACGNDDAAAFTLYRWNLLVASTIQEVLGLFEVALRNAIDPHVGAWQLTAPPAGGRPYGRNWLAEPHPLLSNSQGARRFAALKDNVDKAIRGKGRSPTHGDFVAQTTLGTWRYLLPPASGNVSFTQRLWDSNVKDAFPHLRRNHGALTFDVNRILRLRNRIAHYEPVLDTTKIFDDTLAMRRVLNGIDPDLKPWFDRQSRVAWAIAQRP